MIAWALILVLQGFSRAVEAFADDWDTEEVWLLSPKKISVPDFRLRAIRPSSPSRSPLVFSCSVATHSGTPVNVAWELESMEGTTVLDVQSRNGTVGSTTVLDSLLTISPPENRHRSSVVCRIRLAKQPDILLKAEVVTSTSEGLSDGVAEHGQLGRGCWQKLCNARGSSCLFHESSNQFAHLCTCPPGREHYDKFYDVCYVGRGLKDPCLFSETCSAVDANSRCANGRCECLEGHQVHYVGACRRWASYDEHCDNEVRCLEDGVECVDGLCTCDRGRERFNGSCRDVVGGMGSLNVKQTEKKQWWSTSLAQKAALGGSVVITMTGVILAIGSLCDGSWGRGEKKTEVVEETPRTRAIRNAKFPEWADANSYYMTTRFWVSEQPYFSLPHRTQPYRMYFTW